MKNIPTLILCFSLGVFSIPRPLPAQDRIEPPVPEKQFQPEYPADLTAFVIEPARVEIVIDPQGVPYSLQSLTSLPDNVVQALSKWRFTPAKKNGKAVGFALGIVVPIHRPIPNMGRSRLQTRAKDINDAFAAAKGLDAAGAARLEQQLKRKPDDLSRRLTLLAFARTETDEETRQMRLRQILWLASNQPKHDILAAPYAIATAPSPADAGTFEQIRQVWLKQLEQDPSDAAILDHATNFLRFSDPEIVEKAIQPLLDVTDRAAISLGDLYGLSALGATAVNPNTGNVSATSEKMADSPFAVKARNILDKTEDLRVLFSALSTVSSAGLPLAKAGATPAGYADLCGRLLARAREAYPEVQDKCVTTLPPGATGSTVQAATLTNMIRPTYPAEAKLRRITGVVGFQAMIGKDGRVHNLELLHGPLLLYSAARDAVLQWEYKPTRLDNVPVDVATTIDVTFDLN